MGYIGKIQFFGVMLFVHCGYLLLAMSKQVSAGKPFNVSFDHRALIIDGSRRMLISAGIHYPRAAPEVRTVPCCFIYWGNFSAQNPLG